MSVLIALNLYIRMKLPTSHQHFEKLGDRLYFPPSNSPLLAGQDG